MPYGTAIGNDCNYLPNNEGPERCLNLNPPSKSRGFNFLNLFRNWTKWRKSEPCCICQIMSHKKWGNKFPISHQSKFSKIKTIDGKCNQPFYRYEILYNRVTLQIINKYIKALYIHKSTSNAQPATKLIFLCPPNFLIISCISARFTLKRYTLTLAEVHFLSWKLGGKQIN